MKKKRFYIIWASIAALILGTGIFVVANWVKEIPYDTVANADFSATIADQAGVDINTTFKMLFDTDVSSASVRKYLTVEPEISLGVHQGNSKNEVLIVPVEPLAEGQVYKFTITTENKKLTWAIQTKNQLNIVDTEPADRATDVSLYSAIELKLNQMTNVDLEQINDYISISPEITGSWQQNGRCLYFQPAIPLAEHTVYRISVKEGLPLSDSDLTLASGMELAFETTGKNWPSWRLTGNDSYLANEYPQFILENTAQEDTAVFEADLYRFTDAQSYAASLNSALNNNPSWSQRCLYSAVNSTSGASLVKTFSLVAENGIITLPEKPGAGYYLLRCSKDGYSCDTFFCVSAISAWTTNDGKNTLMWLHDTTDDQPISSAIISDANDQQTAITDENGVTVFPAAEEGIYYIDSPDIEDPLIIPVKAGTACNTESYDNYRYLYLDNSSYESDGTVNFWGIVKPKDGSELAYGRVSVYIISASLEKEVYKDFAPLKNNVFSGSISLPDLMDGEYTLQISQSGQILIEQSFSVGADNFTTAPLTNSPAASRQLRLDSSSYTIGSGYLAQCDIPAEDYLFLESDCGIGKYNTSTERDYLASFSPENHLNNYLTCICYSRGHYTATDPQLIQRDCEEYRLEVTASSNSRLKDDISGDSGTLNITVTDASGLPAQSSLAVSMLLAEDKPDVNTFSAIFEDAPPYYAGENTQTNSAFRNSLMFTVLRTDEKGQASCDYQLPSFSGTCWLVIQAIDGADMRSGSLTVKYGEGYGSTVTEDEQQIPAEEAGQTVMSVSLQKLTNDTVIPANKIISIFGSQDRLQVISVLINTVLENSGDNITAAQAFAYSHGRQLLLDYGGEQMAVIAGAPIDLAAYQQTDGGIGNDGTSDLSLGLKAIATAPSNIDYAALISYFDSCLTSRQSRLGKIMALTGSAIYGEPVLNDVNIMLQSADLSDLEYLWLLWADYACGNRLRATKAFDQWSAENRELSADETALAGILCALTRHDCDNDHMLNAGQILASPLLSSGYELDKVLIARLLLPQLLQDKTSFSYTCGTENKQVEMYGINDYLIPSAECDISFSDISGDVWLLTVGTEE